MNDVDWLRLRQLFHEALDLPADQRRVFIDEHCADTPALGDQLWRFLCEADSPDSGLADRRWSQISTSEPPEPLDTDTLVAGRYRLHSQLGAGGMGIVYLAQRADGAYEGQVALKVLRPELGTRLTASSLERLQSERQILAGLHHPHITRLLDGGTTSDGRPFLVMDHVEGEPIDRYCDRHDLGIEARLRLFIQVCEAVHFAHQNLILHRDLKPANILVTQQGEPKLLDFGIAKLLDPTAHRSEPLTAAGLQPMTLEYASPEQLRSEPLTIGVDVYALGVLLYELLTGTRPFELGDLSLDDFVHAVTETPPDLPSQRVTSRIKSRRLGGDLDTIVAKALHKQPQRRYASSDELARDLQRYLDGQPVQARPDTLGYRFGKFLRRYPWRTAAAALALVGTLVFSFALQLQAGEIHHQAQRNAIIIALLQEIFGISSSEFNPADAQFLRDLPPDVRSTDITVLQALNIAEGYLKSIKDETLRADFRVILGDIFKNLGEYDKAERLLTAALRYRREHRNDLEVAEALTALGELKLDLRAVDEAQEHFDEVDPFLTGRRNRPTILEYRLLRGRGRAALQRSNFLTAREHYQASLELAVDTWGGDNPKVATSLLALAEVHRRQGETELARDKAELALTAFRDAFPKGNHPSLAAALISLGLLAERSGDYKQAAELIGEAVQIRRVSLEPEHPAIADALHALAGIHLMTKNFQQAETSIKEALAIRQAAFGEASPPVAASLNLQGLLLTKQGQHAQAEPHHRRALEIWQEALGERDALTASAHNNLGYALDRQGQDEGAREHYDAALNIYQGSLGEEHFQVGRVLNNLGSLHLDASWTDDTKLPLAVTALQEAEVILSSAGDNEDLVKLRLNLALALERQEHPERAAALYTHVITTYEQRQWPRSDLLLTAETGLGRTLRDRGLHAEAITQARQTLDQLDPASAAQDPHRARVLGILVDSLTAIGDYDRAEAALQELFEVSERLNSEAVRVKAQERAERLEAAR